MFIVGDSTKAARGGGGGIGGGAYISLPQAREPPTEPRTARPAPPVPPTPIPHPVEPAVVIPPATEPSLPSPAPPESAVAGAASKAAGPVDGGGGGGAGGGLGPGVGPGRGPGTGGGEGPGREPVPKQMIIPPENAPKSLRNRPVEVTFQVDADGVVLHVAIEPEIEDKDYARRFLEAMRHYRFKPALNAAGTPVPGVVSITITIF